SRRSAYTLFFHFFISSSPALFILHSFPTRRSSDLDFAAVAAAIVNDAGSRMPDSFRVSATRADKRLPFTSPQVEREVGGLIKQRSEEHTSELQSLRHLVCRLLLEKKKKKQINTHNY